MEASNLLRLQICFLNPASDLNAYMRLQSLRAPDVVEKVPPTGALPRILPAPLAVPVKNKIGSQSVLMERGPGLSVGYPGSWPRSPLLVQVLLALRGTESLEQSEGKLFTGTGVQDRLRLRPECGMQVDKTTISLVWIWHSWPPFATFFHPSEKKFSFLAA